MAWLALSALDACCHFKPGVFGAALSESDTCTLRSDAGRGPLGGAGQIKPRMHANTHEWK